MKNEPWKSGPKELLLHGLEHLSLETEFDYRMGMIVIDNSVELMMKTYLGLPKRITKLNGVTRKLYDEATKSFPNLLDTMESFAKDKLIGIELGEIEWYHRIRNQLYHDGNGITVEKEKVIAYSSIAKILFENLFGEKIDARGKKYGIDDFLLAWADFNKLIVNQGPKIYRLKNFKELFQLSNKEELTLAEIIDFRNKLVHKPNEIDKVELNSKVQELIEFIELVKNRNK
ncbi:hypothetical protein MWU65_17185 [Cellulophaga sp. F20128]|uniref:hypothetical protein n=1 Tax=Cellulophaga sp. F20128 TaxID=2926413 RepID=UPI001FF10E51|nr:hypothetical protein [Cellulophaga sp. F20128]MCK0158925.1 hypothetical protein [Cellulophaga sp. F20128]